MYCYSGITVDRDSISFFIEEKMVVEGWTKLSLLLAHFFLCCWHIKTWASFWQTNTTEYEFRQFLSFFLLSSGQQKMGQLKEKFTLKWNGWGRLNFWQTAQIFFPMSKNLSNKNYERIKKRRKILFSNQIHLVLG